MKSVNVSSVKSVAPKKLVLIDASALIYRAYYALPPLSTNDGMLVNAVFGFTKALFHAISTLQPKYMVVVFDSKGPTFRHKEYKAYKATRPKPPENLISQIPLVREICKVLNIPYFEAPGYEADDLIGTIAAETAKIKNQKSKIKNIILTGDMDTLQLVNDSVNVYSMARGVNKAVIYDEKAVWKKYGFGPEYVIDYKALRGDPSDNIPGVPGIGGKTATQLIKVFGSIENLYEEISNYKFQITNKSQLAKSQIPNQLLKPKTIDLLLRYKDQAFLSKHLATINKQAPVKFNLADAKIHDYDQQKAIKLFNKLGFKSLINKLPKVENNHRQEKLF